MLALRLKSYYHHNFTPEQLADYHANCAQGEELLQQLSAARPLSADADQEQEYLRFVASIAKQYRGLGLGWLELLKAGHASLTGYSARHPEMKDETANFIAWAVREGILMALDGK